MRNLTPILSLVCTAALMATTAYAGDILVDYSPASGGNGSTWYNECCDHYYAEDVTFETDTLIDGIDVYTDFAATADGDYMISIWLDNGFFAPGDLWMQWTQPGSGVESESAHGITYYRHAADFSPITLDAGQTYWIGMTSVAGWHLGQAAVNAPSVDDGLMAWFQVDSFFAMTNVGDMSFRLRGGSSGGPSLSINGCPDGPVSLQLTGVTPGGNAALIYSPSQGSFTIPGGLQCGGTMTGLGGTPQLAGIFTADASGVVTLNGVPNLACSIYIQGVDATTCGTSNVVGP